MTLQCLHATQATFSPYLIDAQDSHEPSSTMLPVISNPVKTVPISQTLGVLDAKPFRRPIVTRKEKRAKTVDEDQAAYGSNGNTLHQPLRVVDLFCGAGGLSFGLRQAGCEVIYAADNFGAAIDTHNRNLGSHAHRVALDWDTKLPGCDVIVGGPPCQGFSTAGLRKAGDRRNTLVAVFAHLVATHKPQAFIFENVEGFLTGEGGRWVCDLLDPLIRAGYCIHLRKINAASPIKRLTGKGGRQVDCIKGKKAYEFKVRVTIAASGQGRWGEELAFPDECKASGYKPILVVLDPTKNPKLTELERAFKRAGGKSYIGLEAWKHIENEAGATMASFLEKYIRHPLNALSTAAEKDLPNFAVKMEHGHVEFTIGAEKLRIKRQGSPLVSEKPDMPDDVSD